MVRNVHGTKSPAIVCSRVYSQLTVYYADNISYVMFCYVMCPGKLDIAKIRTPHNDETYLRRILCTDFVGFPQIPRRNKASQTIRRSLTHSQGCDYSPHRTTPDPHWTTLIISLRLLLRIELRHNSEPTVLGLQLNKQETLNTSVINSSRASTRVHFFSQLRIISSSYAF